MLRIIIAPFVFLMLISDDSDFVQIAVFLFILGAITDTIDGWYARRFDVETSIGKFVDPLADKFLTIAAFLAFVIIDIIPFWMVLIIIVRDIGTTLLRVYADSKNYNMKTSVSAKIKTTIQMIFIALVLTVLFLVNSDFSAKFNSALSGFLYSDYLWAGMLILALITFWTLIEYIINNKGLFINGSRRKKAVKKS